jgi:hypothetical protein
LHRITLAALWATAAPDIATSAATAATAISTANLLFMFDSSSLFLDA